MSVPEKKLHYLSVEDYLKNEETAKVRHEFVDGQIFAMVGTNLRHNIIASNLQAIIQTYLRGSRCRAFITDVRLRVEATNSFYYPDVFVSCCPVDTTSAFVSTPILIIEVSSPSTFVVDKREKLLAYSKIESLIEYAIVHQDKKFIELHRKSIEAQDAHWQTIQTIAQGESAVFEAFPMEVGQLTIPIDKIYEGVDWGQPSNQWKVREAFEEISW